MVRRLSDNRTVPARFYTPVAERLGDLVALPDDEAEHLTRVLRLKPGVLVRVFNGRGGEFEAVVENVSKAGVRVRLQARREPSPEVRVAFTLAQAVLKGEKMDDVVRDAVMMGVSAIQPMVTTRSEVTLASLRRSHRQDRWRRIAVSSAKQCGRAVVPTVLEPCSFEEVVLSSVVTSESPQLMFVEPSSSVDVIALGALDTTLPRACTLLVGPEGGWMPDEVGRGAASWRLVTMGARTLRADAMAIVAVTALLVHWRQL